MGSDIDATLRFRVDLVVIMFKQYRISEHCHDHGEEQKGGRDETADGLNHPVPPPGVTVPATRIHRDAHGFGPAQLCLAAHMHGSIGLQQRGGLPRIVRDVFGRHGCVYEHRRMGS